LQNSPLESSFVVVALIENFSISKTLNVPPEKKSQFFSFDTLVANERYVVGKLISYFVKFLLPVHRYYIIRLSTVSNHKKISGCITYKKYAFTFTLLIYKLQSLVVGMLQDRMRFFQTCRNVPEDKANCDSGYLSEEIMSTASDMSALVVGSITGKFI
jgi:hypothetical protein